MEDNKFIDIALNENNLDLYYHRTAIFQALKESLPLLSGSLLDTACGAMPYRQYVLDHSGVTQYVGLDIATAIAYSDTVKPDVTWDGEIMPFDDNCFDSAIATEVLEHVPDPVAFLRETHRVMKSGCTLFFTVPFLWPLHETPHDEYRYTPYAMERLLKEAGFTNIRIEPLGGWHASMAQMIGLWLRRSPMQTRKRKILTQLFFPLYKYLLKKDQKTIGDGQMITGISGTAHA
jgi:SAM-dependent methyltransferase